MEELNKDFPSLKDKEHRLGNERDGYDYYFYWDDIADKCLDKEKVKNAIIESLKEGFGEKFYGIDLETDNETQLLASLIFNKLGLSNGN